MKASQNKTSKTSRKQTPNNDVANPDTNNDADADLALALSLSSEQNSATGYQDEFAMQQYLMQLKEQEEADAAYARQLAEEYNQEATQLNTSATGASNANLESRNLEPIDDGDNMDSVLEEIARMEAQERLKATGHAYHGKTNINRILADEDEEESRIRQKVKRNEELRVWREERERQDAEFASAEENDRLQKAQQSKETINLPSETTLEPNEEKEPEPVPLTKEELRRARIAFFTATKTIGSTKQ
jgi:hypothetical protein